MKTLKIIFCMIGMLCCSSAFAEDHINISDFSIKPGETKTISVELLNSQAYTAVEFYIKFPEGISVTKKSNGKPNFSINHNRLTDTHSMSMALQSDGNYKVMIYSQENDIIEGTSGALFTIDVVADSNLSEGTYQGKLLGQVLTINTVDANEPSNQSFNINVLSSKNEQSLSLVSLPTRTYGDPDYSLPAKTSQGLTLTWSSDNTSVAVISGNTLTIKGAGSATITAYQEGNASYLSFSKTYTLTVNKAVLTVKADDCSRSEGEENPQFTLSYTGFKYSDNESSLTQKPIATTTANKNSAAGTYPITVSGGQSNNYTFEYVSGTLTIVDPNVEIVDLTHMVGISQDNWHAQGTTATEFAPYVTTSDGRTAPMVEHYEWNVDMLGELMYQELTGLENGKYEVQVYANAYFTDGRGINSDIYEGQSNLAYVSANASRTYLTAHIGTSYSNSDVYTIYAQVTDGRLHIGLTVEKPGCNWYTLQIKSLKLLRNGTIECGTHQVLWCEGNNTLYFLCSDKQYKIGDIYNGWTITDVWSGGFITDDSNHINDSSHSLPEWYEYSDRITKVVISKSFEQVKPKDLGFWFYNCTKITSIEGLQYINTSQTKCMRSMFTYCSSLTSLDLSGWNTSNVTDMVSMFYGCSSLTSLDVSNFDTSNVTDMSGMFKSCSGLKSVNLSGCDLSLVTDITNIFSDCSELESINLSNAVMNNTSIKLCSGISSLKTVNLSNVNISKVTDMSGMFFGCSGLTSLDVSNFDTSKVTGSMYGMFYGCSGLTSLDVSNFDTSKVTDMGHMFYGCSNLTSLDLSHFDTSNVTNMKYMFHGCSNLRNLNLSGCDLSLVTDISNIFNECSELESINLSNAVMNNTSIKLCSGISSLKTVDLSNANTSNVTDMYRMFSGCSSLTSLDLSNFDTSKVTDMGSMFAYCSGLTSLDVTHFDTSNVRGMSGLFFGCSNLTSLDVSDFDTSKVTYMSHMFDDCSSLTSLDVSHFNTSNVTSMRYIFSGCSGLTSLDVSHFDTSNVTDMWHMFEGCSGLTSLDVSNFDTSNVTMMMSMFRGCNKLKTIYCNDTWSCNRSSDMFENCFNLVGGKGFAYDANKTDVTYANPGENGYFTKVPTGIEEIMADESGAMVNVGLIYDMSGRVVGDASKLRIEDMGLEPGFYIVNGKKVMVR